MTGTLQIGATPELRDVVFQMIYKILVFDNGFVKISIASSIVMWSNTCIQIARAECCIDRTRRFS